MSAIERLMRSMSLDLTKRSSRNSRIHLPESMLVAVISCLNRYSRLHEVAPHVPRKCQMTLSRKLLVSTVLLQTLNGNHRKSTHRQLRSACHQSLLKFPLPLLPNPVEVSEQFLIRYFNRRKRPCPTWKYPFQPQTRLNEQQVYTKPKRAINQILSFFGQRRDSLPTSPVVPASSTSRHCLLPDRIACSARAMRRLWRARNSCGGNDWRRYCSSAGSRRTRKTSGSTSCFLASQSSRLFIWGKPGRRTLQTRNSDKTLTNRIVSVDTIYQLSDSTHRSTGAKSLSGNRSTGARPRGRRK